MNLVTRKVQKGAVHSFVSKLATQVLYSVSLVLDAEDTSDLVEENERNLGSVTELGR